MVSENNKRIKNWYLNEDRRMREKMTLIIGAKCKDGVILVSDKKIVDNQTGEVEYKEKLFFPIEGASIVVGAAGYVNLFREFNSKLPYLLNEKITEYRIRNIAALAKIGENIEDYEMPIQKPEEIQGNLK